MRNFQGTFEMRKRSFVSAFSICMAVPLIKGVCVKTSQMEDGLNKHGDQEIKGEKQVCKSFENP